MFYPKLMVLLKIFGIFYLQAVINNLNNNFKCSVILQHFKEIIKIPLQLIYKI